MIASKRGVALLAALLLVLIVSHVQQRRDAAAQQAGRAAENRLVQADQQRIVYRPGALPRLTLPGQPARPVHSLLKVPRQLQHGEFAWADTGTVGPVWIRIDLDRQLISVFRDQDEIGTAVILYGAPERPTPNGAFRVIAKAIDHYSRSYDAPMPFMLRLTADGVAIHASRVRPDGATHGCLGVPLRFAEQLYAVAGTGTEVYIIANPATGTPASA